MIAKGRSITHTAAAVNYAQLKESAEELGRQHLAGDTALEIASEFRMCQSLNQNCERNTMQFVISPSIEDGKRLTDEELKGIYKDFLEKMKIGDRQSIAFLHRDKKHAHIHVYVNRIDFQGIAFKDNFLSNRSSKVAQEIAIERKLTLASDVQKMRLEQQKDLKAEILNRHNVSLQHNPRTLGEYVELMRVNKVNVEIVASKTGKISGLRMEFQGQKFKASEIDRNLSFNKLFGLSKGIAPKIVDSVNMPLKIAKTSLKLGVKIIDQGMSM